MKYYFLLFLNIISFFPVFSHSLTQEKEEFVFTKFIRDIETVGAPIVTDDYIIFRAENARYTGIAFDFENYAKVHSFKRYAKKDANDSIQSTTLFYILQKPSQLNKITYRLVVDGLWTVDPSNNNAAWDTKAAVYVSVVEFPQKTNTDTQKLKTVRFVYEGKEGQHIRLGGSFTHWDSFIYELHEQKPGLYMLELALPKGTYNYNFYSGITTLVDKNNPRKRYTKDGRIASVITVQ